MKLQTMARPDKKQALELAAAVLEGERLSLYDASLLMNYLFPPIPGRSINAWRYVSRVTNTRDGRAISWHVHIQDGMAYGIDGHRAHYAPTDLPDGLYNTAGIKIVGDHQAAKIINLLPKDEPNKTAYTGALPLQYVRGLQVAQLGETWVQLPYLMQGINNQDVFQYVEVENGVLVECKLGRALIGRYAL